MADHIPKVIILLSGKRKSGKDYVAEKLRSAFLAGDVPSENSVIIRISGPLKKEYARLHGLAFDRLLDSSPYKEDFRKEMVRWSDEIRRNDPFYFCHLAASEAAVSSKAVIWIVSDIRRPADIRYFTETFGEKRSVPVLKIRLEANQETRIKRGWKFEAGVDDAETECALDSGVNWDLILLNDDYPDNSDSENPFLISFRDLISRIRGSIE